VHDVRIQVTNDDGISSEGLQELVRHLAATEHEIVVIAPDADWSGAGTSLASSGEGYVNLGEIRSERVTIDGAEEVEAHAVAGAPAYTVVVARLGAFGPPPDLIVSGINAGANTGRAVLHSGTVGATNRPGWACRLAINAARPPTAILGAALAVEMLDLVIEAPQRTVLNLNAPACDLEDCRGVRWARLAPFGTMRAAIATDDDDRRQFELQPSGAVPPPDTDVALLLDGFATITTRRGVDRHDPRRGGRHRRPRQQRSPRGRPATGAPGARRLVTPRAAPPRHRRGPDGLRRIVGPLRVIGGSTCRSGRHVVVGGMSVQAIELPPAVTNDHPDNEHQGEQMTTTTGDNGGSATRRRFDGKVVLITGAARGQGREEAVRFAAAPTIGVDLAARWTRPSMATPEDLATTVAMVEAAGGAMVSRAADVRDLAALEGAVAEGLDRFGRLDIVVANAGVMATSLFTELSEQAWDEIVGTNLTGVWKTVRAAAPAIMAGERGGSVVITSSIAGLKGMWVSAPYVASKHGVTGLMKTMALELSPNNIRVNSIHPSSVRTPMIENDYFANMMRGDLDNPTFEDTASVLTDQALDLPWLKLRHRRAVLWLCSDDSGITVDRLPVDGGNMLMG
jgi:5'/3'-nucleotidase SurE